MSLLDLPKEILVLILGYADRETRLKIRLTCKFLSFVRNFSPFEQVNFVKDYSKYDWIQEAVLENCYKDSSLAIKFLEENVGKIETISVILNLFSVQPFEYVKNLFESINCNMIWNLKLYFNFSVTSPNPNEFSFLSKFHNLQTLSINSTCVHNSLDIILNELEQTTFTQLRVFELSVHVLFSSFKITSFNIEHINRIEKVILKMKKLKKLTIEIPIVDSIIEEIGLNPNFLVDFFQNISKNCNELIIRINGFSIIKKLDVNNITNLSLLDINQLPDSFIINSSLRELKIGTYSTIAVNSMQFLKDDFLMGNKFDNLKRLELIRVRNLKGSSCSFPSLENIHCSVCQFNSGIDFFTECRKLKSLVLYKCTFQSPSNVAFKCKELEELDITSPFPDVLFDYSILRGLNLKKLIIHPTENADLSSIEQMESLEYLNILSTFKNISFKKLTNLKYLEFSYCEFFKKTNQLTNLMEDYLLHHCVIHISRVKNMTGLFIPIISGNGTEPIPSTLTEEIVKKLSKFKCGLNNVKFIIICKEKIYISFYIPTNAQPKAIFDHSTSKCSYPSFILFERKSPYTILSSGRSSEPKQTINTENVTISKPPQQCQVQ